MPYALKNLNVLIIFFYYNFNIFFLSYIKYDDYITLGF